MHDLFPFMLIFNFIHIGTSMYKHVCVTLYIDYMYANTHITQKHASIFYIQISFVAVIQIVVRKNKIHSMILRK